MISECDEGSWAHGAWILFHNSVDFVTKELVYAFLLILSFSGKSYA